MKIIVNQSQLSKFLTKFLSEDGKPYTPSLLTKIFKYLHIIGKDEEIGMYILRQIKNENLTDYNFKKDLIFSEFTFSINSFPFKLSLKKIIFNRGGRDMEFTLTSPVFGDDIELDLSYSLLNKIYKGLFNYR